MSDLKVTVGKKSGINVKASADSPGITIKNRGISRTKIAELNDVVANSDNRSATNSVLVYDPDSNTYILTKNALVPNSNGDVIIYGNLIPATNGTINLGSNTNIFKSGFFAANTISIGNLSLSDTGTGTISVGDANNPNAEPVIIQTTGSLPLGNAVFGKVTVNRDLIINTGAFSTGDVLTIAANGSIEFVDRNTLTLSGNSSVSNIAFTSSNNNLKILTADNKSFSVDLSGLTTDTSDYLEKANASIYLEKANASIYLEVANVNALIANQVTNYLEVANVNSRIANQVTIYLEAANANALVANQVTQYLKVANVAQNTSTSSAAFSANVITFTRDDGSTYDVNIGDVASSATGIANSTPLGTSANNITDGAITSLTSETSVLNAIDRLNEALFNVQKDTFVRDVSFTASPTSGGAGTTVTLTISTTGNPNRFDIEWGDGAYTNNTSDSTPSHTYSDNIGSPFDVTVTAKNTGGFGEGSNTSTTETNFITIYLADPTPSFVIKNQLTGGSTITEANTGEAVYLDSTGTGNIPNTDITASFSVDWGDGSSREGIAGKTAAGAPQGARLSHTYSTDSGSSRFTVSFAANTFSGGDPSALPIQTTSLLKVFNVGIAAPNDITTKTISWSSSSSGSSPALAQGFIDNASSSKSAGDTISSSFPRFTSGTKTTASMSTLFHSNGSVTQHINGAQTGTPTIDESGTDFYNFNASGSSVSAANRIYAEDLYETGNKARISYDIGSGSVGVNSAKLVTDEGDSNVLFYVYDSLTSSPTNDISSATLTQSSAGTLSYISGVPYYTNDATLTFAGIDVTNLTGQTYYNGNFITLSGVNVEGTSGSAFSSQTKNYSTALASSDRSANIPNANLSSVSLEDLSVSVNGGGKRAQRLSIQTQNINGSDTDTFSSVIVQAYNGSKTFDEENIAVSDSLGSTFTTDGKRITGFTGSTPSFSGSTDFYTDNAWTGSVTVAGTDEAIVRYDTLSHFTTDLSSGYLPAGPDLNTGRSGTQYFTFAFKRSGVSTFRVRLTGKVSEFFIAAPGTAIDDASGSNGWLDASVQYAGSGVPGSDTGNGGNGSDGCAFTGSDRIIDGTSYSNQTFDLTLGTESSSNAQDNQILINIGLNSDDSLTALSIEAAS